MKEPIDRMTNRHMDRLMVDRKKDRMLYRMTDRKTDIMTNRPMDKMVDRR